MTHTLSQSTVGVSLTDQQLIQAIKTRLVSIEEIFQESQDEEVFSERHNFYFFVHIDRLVRELYIRSKLNKKISKMRACKLIPADHVETCKKYIGQAEEREIIYFENDDTDKRVKNVRLSKKYVQLIDDLMLRKMSILLDILDSDASMERPL